MTKRIRDIESMGINKICCKKPAQISALIHIVVVFLTNYFDLQKSNILICDYFFMKSLLMTTVSFSFLFQKFLKVIEIKRKDPEC